MASPSNSSSLSMMNFTFTGSPPPPWITDSNAHDLGVVLALVVVRPARPDRAVLDPRRKRRVLPEIDRVHGLHVHVP